MKVCFAPKTERLDASLDTLLALLTQPSRKKDTKYLLIPCFHVIGPRWLFSGSVSESLSLTHIMEQTFVRKSHIVS
jgi:hypothetical protein